MAEGDAKGGPSSPMTPEERWERLKADSDLWPADAAVVEMIRAAVAEEREKVVRLFARVQSLLISLQNESARRRVEDEKTEMIMMRLLADIREFVPAGTRSEKDDAIRNRA